MFSNALGQAYVTTYPSLIPEKRNSNFHFIDHALNMIRFGSLNMV